MSEPIESVDYWRDVFAREFGEEQDHCDYCGNETAERVPPVEFVRGPDEQAIERAVDALMADSGLPQFGPHRVAVERRFRLGLTAALEQPE